MTYHRSSPCTRVAGPKLEQPYTIPPANRRLNAKHCSSGHSVGLGFPCGYCSPLYWATIGRPWFGGWLESCGFWRSSAASLAVVSWLGNGWFLLVFKGTCQFCQTTALMRGNLFLPCFRWKNWRGLFAACHFLVSLIYVLDVVAQLRFLGCKFWKLIGSALAPSTAGWATNHILRIIHGINRKVLLTQSHKSDKVVICHLDESQGQF